MRGKARRSVEGRGRARLAFDVRKVFGDGDDARVHSHEAGEETDRWVPSEGEAQRLGGAGRGEGGVRGGVRGEARGGVRKGPS